MKTNFILVLASWLMLGVFAFASSTQKVLVLCYHDVPVQVEDDPYAVDVMSFVEQIEYMRHYGATFVSPSDIEAANAGKKDLPPKAVLLSFDDAYISFASNVLPIIELYNIPVMLAVCSSWIENGAPEDIVAPLMSWEELKKLANHPLVTIASHSHALHKAVQCNPQGNTAQAAVTRIYDAQTGSYELENAYKLRIENDMKEAKNILKGKIGIAPSIIVWPYGEYNAFTTIAAQQAGFRMAFGLNNSTASLQDIMQLDRWIIMENPDSDDFIENFRMHMELDEIPLKHIRGIFVSLDPIFHPDSEIQEKLLGKFLDRMVILRPSTIFIDVFSSNKKEAYFPNRLLPVKADLLSRVVNQLYIRGFETFLYVSSARKNNINTTEINENEVMTLCRDLFSYTRFHGVLIDYSYIENCVDALTEKYAGMVHKYRPVAKFAVNLPFEKFDYVKSAENSLLNNCDYIMISLDKPEKIFGSTNRRYKKYMADIMGSHRLDRIIIRLPAATREGKFLPDSDLIKWTRILKASGIHHVSYDPDDFIKGRPFLEGIRKEYCSDYYLFDKPIVRKIKRTY